MIASTSWYSRSVVMRVQSLDGEVVAPAWIDLVPRLPTVTFRDNRYAMVDAGDTWATFALQTMGDPRAWKFIAELSGVDDPFTEMEPGDVLTVPSSSTYLFNLLDPGRE